MRWRVYFWKAGNQFLIGDRRIIVDLLGRNHMYFTKKYTASRRPKTLTDLGPLENFSPAAQRMLREGKLLV